MNGKPQRYALVGMKHRGTEALVASLPPDEPLTLVREPGNKYDPNAVQVWARGKHVGYIPKTQNAVLAKFIDEHGERRAVYSRTVDVASDAAMPTDASVKTVGPAISARLHKGSNTYPLVEIAP